MSLSPELIQPCDSHRFFHVDKVDMAHCWELITEKWDEGMVVGCRTRSMNGRMVDSVRVTIY